jgi:hypothetical protein
MRSRLSRKLEQFVRADSLLAFEILFKIGFANPGSCFSVCSCFAEVRSFLRSLFSVARPRRFGRWFADRIRKLVSKKPRIKSRRPAEQSRGVVESVACKADHALRILCTSDAAIYLGVGGNAFISLMMPH